MSFVEQVFEQIIIGIIAIFAAFVISLTWDAGRRGRVYWRARRFWRPFLTGDVKIIVDKFDKFRDWEPSGLVGVGGMQATLEVRALLNDLGFNDLGLRRTRRRVEIVYHDQIQGNLGDYSLVCIGGPDANRITERIVNRLNSAISLGIPEDNDITIRDLQDDRKPYLPEGYRADGKNVVTLDHGVVIRAKNPYNRERCVIIVAGTYGYGTWAAAKLLRSPQFLASKPVKRGCDVECLSKAEIIKEVPQEPEILIVRPIPEEILNNL